MFFASDATIAGLVVGTVLSFLVVCALVIWRLSAQAPGGPMFRLLLNGAIFAFAAVVIGTIQSDKVAQPCFFGLKDARGIDSACDFGAALGSVTLVLAVAGMGVALLATRSHTGFVFDAVSSFCLFSLWITLSVYLSVLLDARQTRCAGGVAAVDGGSPYRCDDDLGFANAVAATVFSYIAMVTCAVAVADSFGRLHELTARWRLKSPIISVGGEVLRAVTLAVFTAIVSKLGEPEIY
jgi:hypothetical protein